MARSTLFLFVCLSFLFSWKDPLAKTADYSHLRVLSYNIKGLPWPFAKNHYRYRVIGEMLKHQRQRGQHPDVVLLQESFISKTKELQRAAGYKNNVKGPNNGWRVYGSGLYILTDHEVLETHEETFGGDCGRSDCLSNKGVMHVRIQREGESTPIDLFTTHLQSGRKYDYTRIRQLETLLAFVDKHSDPDVPVVMAGDFNFEPEEGAFEHMSATEYLAAGRFCLDNSSKCKISAQTDPTHLEADTHDYHFYLGTKDVEISPVYVERNYHQLYNGAPLSDHLGFQVDYRLEGKN